MECLQVLFDSGCGATLINKKLVKGLSLTKEKKTRWTTKAGKFSTSERCKATFTLPAFHKHCEVQWNCYVDNSDPATCKYDMIIGRDLMQEIGLDILISKQEMVWDNASVPMQSIDKVRTSKWISLN